MRVLFIGDIVSKAGRRIVGNVLPGLKSEFDFVIANGENVSGGRGLNREHADMLLKSGIDCFTGGNHIFDNKEIAKLFEAGYPIVRPLNFPGDALFGPGDSIIEKNGKKLRVISLVGNTVFEKAPNPFIVADEILGRHQDIPCLIDFHGERTSEKIAFPFHVDGRVSVVVGTHTHVATADARVLSKGTGVITDVGMTGAIDSVLGVEAEIIINRFMGTAKSHFKFANTRAAFRAVKIHIDDITRRCKSIEQLIIEESE